MTDRIDVTGTVDIHTHVGPSPFDRRVDGYEAAAEAGAADMDAIVMKEHLLPTVYGTTYIDRLLEREGTDIDVLGSTVLNYSNGGFNPFAVQSAIDYGAKVVWGPTIDARQHAEQTGQLGAFLNVDAGEEYADKEGITALDSDGEIRTDIRLCIEKIAANDVVLALGHLSNEETFAMVEYAADLGHEKILIDHPNYSVTDLDRDQQAELVSLGAVLNFPFMAISPKYQWISSEELAENIREIGVDNCVVSSDVGQQVNPTVPESLRILGEVLLSEGFSVSEFRAMADQRPKRLLDLD